MNCLPQSKKFERSENKQGRATSGALVLFPISPQVNSFVSGGGKRRGSREEPEKERRTRKTWREGRGGGSSCVYARMSACAPLLTYARAYAHGARLPPACVFIFIIILDIFYISYNNIYKKTRKLYVLSISLYSCLYRTRAGTHIRR